jgi:hypothetical protein
LGVVVGGLLTRGEGESAEEREGSDASHGEWVVFHQSFVGAGAHRKRRM